MEESLKNLHNQFTNSYTQLLFDRYKKYEDFRLLVDFLANNEKKHRGHCGTVQDAAKLADLITYNHFVRSNLK
jgi:hypothetical protein